MYLVVILLLVSIKRLSPRVRHIFCFGFSLILLMSLVWSVAFPKLYNDFFSSARSVIVRNLADSNPDSYVSRIADTIPRIDLSESPNDMFNRCHWTFWFLSICISGAMALYAKMLWGKISLLVIRFRATAVERKDILSMFSSLRFEMSVRRNVRLYVSSHFRVPVTGGVFSPVIFIPEKMQYWPLPEMKVILSHELAHIKRFDCLTQEIAGICCALFWFLPFVWHITALQRIEQEAASDSDALSAGVQPRIYAKTLLMIARYFIKGRYSSGVSIGGIKRTLIESRIVQILNCHGTSRHIVVSDVVKLLAGSAVIFVIMTFIAPTVPQEDYGEFGLISRKLSHVEKDLYNLSLDFQNNTTSVPILWPVADGSGWISYDEKRKYNSVIIHDSKPSDVIAAAEGVITGYHRNDEGLTSIVITHEDGVSTHYENLSGAEVLHPGEYIPRGGFLGMMTKDRNDEYWSVQYSMTELNNPVDPREYLKKYGSHIYISKNGSEKEPGI